MKRRILLSWIFTCTAISVAVHQKQEVVQLELSTTTTVANTYTVIADRQHKTSVIQQRFGIYDDSWFPTLVPPKHRRAPEKTLLSDFSNCESSYELDHRLIAEAECETIVLSGNFVNLKHIDAARKTRGLRYLILESCPEDLRKSRIEPIGKSEIVFSQRKLINTLLEADERPGIIVLKNVSHSSHPRYIDTRHFQQVVELGRDRFQYPIYGNKISTEIQGLIGKLWSLRIIDLGRTTLHKKLFEELEKLPDLEVLLLDGVDCHPVLQKKFRLSSLKHLDLSGSTIRNPIGDTPNLKVLRVNNTMIVDSFFEQSFPNLEKLSVHNTRLGEKGIMNISVLPRLKELTLDLAWQGKACIEPIISRGVEIKFYSQDWGAEKAPKFIPGSGLEMPVDIPAKYRDTKED